MTGLLITPPRLVRLLKSLLRLAYWIAALVAVVYFCNYLLDAHTRTTRVPACEWDKVENPNNGTYDKTYFARVCYLARDVYLVRVHHADGTLVAERTYDYPAFPKIYWEPDGVSYVYDKNGRGALGFIDIPPTLLDRLLAKLP